MGKRELVALLNLSSCCLVMVEWLFLAVPWGYLRFVVVVFPDHTHILVLDKLFMSPLTIQNLLHLQSTCFFISNKNSVFRCGVDEPFLDQNIGYHCPIYCIFKSNKMIHQPSLVTSGFLAEETINH